MRATATEAQVSAAIRALLDAHRIPYHRLNSGTTVIPSANGKRRVIRMAAAGTADILALVSCVTRDRMCDCGDTESARVMPLYIEVKREHGGVQSPAQMEFQDRVEANGFAYLLARSSDEVLAWMRERGVVR